MSNILEVNNKLVIETDGTTLGTKLLVDGQPLSALKSCQLKIDAEEVMIDINLEQVKDTNVEYVLVKFNN